MPIPRIPYGLLDGRYVNVAGDTMTGDLTVPNLILPDGGTVGQAAGPLLTFDDTLNYLEISGCWVGMGTPTPNALLHVRDTGGALPGGLTATAIIQNDMNGQVASLALWGHLASAVHFGYGGVETHGSITYFGNANPLLSALSIQIGAVPNCMVLTGTGTVIARPLIVNALGGVAATWLEVVDPGGGPQVRMTHTVGAQYVDFQCTGASQLTINNAGNETLRLTQLGVLSVDASGVGLAAQVDEFDEYDDPVEIESLLKGRNTALMEQLGVIERKKGGYMWRLQPLLRLFGGAIYQLNQKNKALEAELAEIRSMVESLA